MTSAAVRSKSGEHANGPGTRGYGRLRRGSPARRLGAWGAPGTGQLPPGRSGPHPSAVSSPPQRTRQDTCELLSCGRAALLAGRERVTAKGHRSRALRPRGLRVAARWRQRHPGPPTFHGENRHLSGGRGECRAGVPHACPNAGHVRYFALIHAQPDRAKTGRVAGWCRVPNVLLSSRPQVRVLLGAPYQHVVNILSPFRSELRKLPASNDSNAGPFELAGGAPGAR